MISPYRSLLSLDGARGLVATGLIGRFPLSMLGLGTVLLVRAETGSYALAGSVSGTMAVATAVAGPVTGSLADRWGQGRVLRPLLAIFGVTASILVVAATADGVPTWLVVVHPFGVGIGPTTIMGTDIRPVRLCPRWIFHDAYEARFDSGGARSLFIEHRAIGLDSPLVLNVGPTNPVRRFIESKTGDLSAQEDEANGGVVANVLAILGGFAFAGFHVFTLIRGGGGVFLIGAIGFGLATVGFGTLRLIRAIRRQRQVGRAERRRISPIGPAPPA